MKKPDLIELIQSHKKSVQQAADAAGTNRQNLYTHRAKPERLEFEQIAKLSQFLQTNYSEIVGENCKLF